jgi:hypothetical protein
MKKLQEEKNLLDTRLTSLRKKSDSEKSHLVESIKNLKERNANLTKNLRMQMVSTNKIDNIRQKMSDRWKELTLKNQELENSIIQKNVEIESLNKKLGGGDTLEHMQFEKTKGTLSDKDETTKEHTLIDQNNSSSKFTAFDK